MGEVKFTEWLRRESERCNICSPALPAQRAIKFICDYLLGEDWYCVMPMHTEQVNAEIVHEILWKYSRKYRKEYKACIRKIARSKNVENA